MKDLNTKIKAIVSEQVEAALIKDYGNDEEKKNRNRKNYFECTLIYFLDQIRFEIIENNR